MNTDDIGTAWQKKVNTKKIKIGNYSTIKWL